MKHESIHYHEDRRNCPDCIGNGRCPGHAVTLTTMASVPLDELQALEACAEALRRVMHSRDEGGQAANAALARHHALKEPKEPTR